MCAVIGRRRDRLVLQLACGSASPLTCTGTGLGRAVVSGPEAGGATGLASAGTGRLRRRALSPNRRGTNSTVDGRPAVDMCARALHSAQPGPAALTASRHRRDRSAAQIGQNCADR
jgi:hypothetical protein